jgi:plasmanylethanolamine desaturase
MAAPRDVHRALEIAAMGVGAVLLLVTVARILPAIEGTAAAAAVIGGLLVGYLVADLLGGLVHWAADTYGSIDTPVLGPGFIAPFRYHHEDPDDITRHDIVETNGNSCILAVPVLGVALLTLPDPAARPGWLFAWTVVLSFVLAGILTNQLHKWAHMTSPPRAARALQRLGLILAREHHLIHHAAPFRTHYCITAGWFNAPLHRWRAHEALERLLRPFATPTHEAVAR